MQRCQIPTRSPSVSTTLPCHGFLCKNSTCLPGYRRCDHYVDCQWGEDEANCGCKNSTEWKCPVGDKCIPLRHVCDKIVDCPQGEDENQCPVTVVPGKKRTTVSPATNTPSMPSGSGSEYQLNWAEGQAFYH